VVLVTAVAGFGYEVALLGRRSWRRFYRVPANFLGIVLFPLIQLFVFSQLYQGITALPGFGGGGSYLAYLAPGQIVFAAFFATAWSGTNLVVDINTGYLDKLRATPVHRFAILAGELIPLFLESALMAGCILVLAVLMGAPLVTGVPGLVLILFLSGSLGVAWAGTSYVPALLTKSEQATGTLSILAFPIAFMSTAFVPRLLMPEWIQVLNDWNPLTYVIEAIRPLMITGYDWPAFGRALVAVGLLGVVLHSVSMWAFRRLTD
jgi:ABC-2 type transport system permease protein